MNRKQKREATKSKNRNYFTKKYTNSKSKFNAFDVLPKALKEELTAIAKSKKVVKPISKNKLNKLKKVAEKNDK